MRHSSCLALSGALSLCANLALALTPVVDPAAVMRGRDWQLLAIDGNLIAPDVTASLFLGPENGISGQAPCNAFSAQNQAVLPALSLGPITATKMACEQLAEEVAFFDTLSAMQAAALDGEATLILTGPGGRSMEFVTSRADAPGCKTCSD